jgi:multimeric flavodoxin WrbA
MTPEQNGTGKKVLVLIGSPRKNGSTAILAREAGRGLSDRGIVPEFVFLNDLNARGCQACYHCKKNNVAECVVKDDMQEIHQMMRESDGIIVAAPIYFGDVSAQTKTWLDRLFPFIGMDLSSKMPGKKKISFIFTQNQPDEKLFEAPVRSFMYMTGLTGLVTKDCMIAYDLDAGQKPPVTGKKEFMDRAYGIGMNLVEQP